MIKNLLNADEEPPEGVKVTIEDRLINSSPEIGVRNEEFRAAREITEREIFEIPESAKFFTPSSENPLTTEKTELPEHLLTLKDQVRLPENHREDDDLLEIAAPANYNYQTPKNQAQSFELPSFAEKNEQRINNENDLPHAEAAVETPPAATGFDLPNASEINAAPLETAPEAPLVQADYAPETPDETIRKSGLAYSAAVVLLVSIVFMMILGWFADLLFGSSPYGIVGGIILGAIVGFIQFFRITSSILK